MPHALAALTALTAHRWYPENQFIRFPPELLHKQLMAKLKEAMLVENQLMIRYTSGKQIACFCMNKAVSIELKA